MATSVSAVYIHVVDSVIGKLRDEFVSEGVDDNVLNELQTLWEAKMMQCGIIQGPIERNSVARPGASATPVHDLNVPYEGREEYETPTAEMLFPPTPVQTPLPVDPTSYLYTPAGPIDYINVPEAGNTISETKGVRPAPYMQPPSPWMNRRHVGVNVNIAYEEGRDEEEGGPSQQPMTKDFFTMTSGKRKRDDYAPPYLPGGYIPQQDGSGDNVSLQTENAGTQFNGENQDRLQADATIASVIKMKNAASFIPQIDGLHDVYEEDVANEDYNVPYYDPLTPHNAATPKPTKTEVDDDDEPSLNEDDDDDDLDDVDQGDEEPTTNHLVLAQFEKVSRTKSRWKCTLKDGIMRLNNKDILFMKATGEFDF